MEPAVQLTKVDFPPYESNASDNEWQEASQSPQAFERCKVDARDGNFVCSNGLLHPSIRRTTGALMIAKAQLPLSLCAFVLVALAAASLAHAEAPLRMIDRLQARPHDALQAQKEALQQSIARGTFKLRYGTGKQNKRGPAADPATFALPHWTSSFRTEGIDYPFTVVGTDPAARQATVVPTFLIPYRFVFADGGVVDATQDIIDGTTPLAGMMASPIFNDYPFTAGATSLGNTQFGDAYMRGNFWSRHGGQSSTYRVRLDVAGVLQEPLVITVPAELGFSVKVGEQTIGVIDYQTMVDLSEFVIAAFDIPASWLSVHVTGQLITTGSVSFAGFHSWFDARVPPATTPDLRTYIIAGYFSSELAPGHGNSQVLAHEVVEWLMDPLVSNVVPPWRDPVTPNWCSNPLMEVADPLEHLPGATYVLGGQSFSLPDVVFSPWFAKTPKSNSVNGWFSLRNTVTSAAAACPYFEFVGAFYFPNDVGMTEAQLTSYNTHKQATGYFVQFGEIVGFVLGNVDPAGVDPITFDVVSVPGALYTIPAHINDLGQIVGLYVDGSGGEHGFLLANGKYATIDVPGALATEALGINGSNNPTIVGNYVDASGKLHGFTLRNGIFKQLDVPSAVATSIHGINNANQVTGRYQQSASANVRGFTGNLAVTNPLDFVSDTQATTAPGGINNAGVVAGTAVQDGETQGFLFGGGNFIPAVLILVNDINDSGGVAGSLFIGGALVAAFGVPIDPHVFGPMGASQAPIALPTGALRKR